VSDPVLNREWHGEMSKELPTISKLARDFGLGREEIRTLLTEHEVPSDRILTGNVVDEDHLPRLIPILEAYALKKARRLQIAQTN
jgi:hypothetical protein